LVPMLASLRQRLDSLGIGDAIGKAVLRAVVEGGRKKLEGKQLAALAALAGSGVLKRSAPSKAAATRQPALQPIKRSAARQPANPSRYRIDPFFSAEALNFYAENPDAVPNVGFVPKAFAYENTEANGRIEKLDLDFFAKTHGHESRAVKEALAAVRANGKTAVAPEHAPLLGQLERLGVIERNKGARQKDTGTTRTLSSTNAAYSHTPAAAGRPNSLKAVKR